MSIGDLVAAGARKVLPESVLLHLRGDFTSVRHRFITDPLERARLLWHRLKGGTYLDWYARRQDGFAVGRQQEDPKLQKAFYDSGAVDVETMKALGLKPSHRVHEFGCGFLRSARYTIEYLDEGKFSANDASAERMKAGEVYFRQGGFDIRSKSPRLIVNTDNTLDWVGEKVDYVWCHAVFTHMPEPDIDEVIRNFEKILHAGSVCLFTYSEKPGSTRPVEHMGVKDWWHRYEFFERIAHRHGYVAEDLGEFLRARDGYRPENRLVKLTLAPSAG